MYAKYFNMCLSVSLVGCRLKSCLLPIVEPLYVGTMAGPQDGSFFVAINYLCSKEKNFLYIYFKNIM